jgi:hypothetical protein
VDAATGVAVKKGVRHSQSDEASIQVGILQGCDWSAQEIAAQLGVTANAIYERCRNPTHAPLIEKVRSWTQIGVTKKINERIKAAEDDFNERKRRLHTKGYRAIEKKLDEVVAEGSTVSIDAVHLRAAEMGIERTEGKPLDRKAILTRNENVTRAEVDELDLNGILGDLEETNRLRKSTLLIAGAVQDADLV